MVKAVEEKSRSLAMVVVVVGRRLRF